MGTEVENKLLQKFSCFLHYPGSGIWKLGKTIISFKIPQLETTTFQPLDFASGRLSSKTNLLH